MSDAVRLSVEETDSSEREISEGDKPEEVNSVFTEEKESSGVYVSPEDGLFPMFLYPNQPEKAIKIMINTPESIKGSIFIILSMNGLPASYDFFVAIIQHIVAYCENGVVISCRMCSGSDNDDTAFIVRVDDHDR